MIKELLEKQQPIVYRALDNACKTNRISSAYLFTGPYGTPKYEAAVLLAQSILCEKKMDWHVKNVILVEELEKVHMLI